MRLLRTALLSLALLGSCLAGAAAQLPTCRGKNVLDELKGSDPAAHARILAQAAATENATAMLWRVERGGKPPSHLFGTMHLTDERIANVSPAVKAALGGARRLLLEVNADDLSASGFMKAFAQRPAAAHFYRRQAARAGARPRRTTTRPSASWSAPAFLHRSRAHSAHGWRA